MFSKLALFATASMAVFVAALPSPGSINNSCNGGTLQCCNELQSASSSAAQDKKGLGVLIPAGVTAGLTCTPISVLALQHQSCTSQTACCTGNSFSGAVVLGCSPVNLNL